jgi:hypothetical protein
MDELLYLQDNGIRVFDANTNSMVQVGGMLLFTTSDIRGTPDVTGKVHGNSIDNACIRCSAIGIKTYGLRKLATHKPKQPDKIVSSNKPKQNKTLASTKLNKLLAKNKSSKSKKRKRPNDNNGIENTEPNDSTAMFIPIPDAVCYCHYPCYLPRDSNYRQVWKDRMRDPTVQDNDGNNISIADLSPPESITYESMLQLVTKAEQNHFAIDIVKATGNINIYLSRII